MALAGIRTSRASCRGANGEADGQSSALRCFLALLFVAVVFGPLPAALIGAATVLIDFGRPFTRWVIWTSNRTLIGGFAGIAAQAAMAHGTNTFGRIIAATSVAAVVDFGLDFVLNGVTLVLRGTGSIRGLARTDGSRGSCWNPALHVARWGTGLFLSCVYPVERRTVLHPGPRRTTSFRYLSCAGPSTCRTRGS